MKHKNRHPKMDLKKRSLSQRKSHASPRGVRRLASQPTCIEPPLKQAPDQTYHVDIPVLITLTITSKSKDEAREAANSVLAAHGASVFDAIEIAVCQLENDSAVDEAGAEFRVEDAKILSDDEPAVDCVLAPVGAGALEGAYRMFTGGFLPRRYRIPS